MPYDIVIVGGGPAGLSAAVNAAARGKTCAVLTNDRRLNPLFRARVVDNYLGMRGLSGGEMLDRMHAEAEEAGAVFLSGRVVSVLPFEDKFLVGLGDTLVEGKRVILATGAMAGTPLPGEAALVGQGVSYCATCDGMLYRGKTAVVTGNAADLREEANFLQGIGVRVTVITRQELDGLDPGIGHRTARSMAIHGDGRLEGFVADGEQIPHRDPSAPSSPQAVRITSFTPWAAQTVSAVRLRSRLWPICGAKPSHFHAPPANRISRSNRW